MSSMRASRPATSPSSGSIRCTILVSRIASSDSSVRCSSRPVLLAYPSLKIRYSTCSTVRSLAVCSSRVGIRNGTPEALMRCFALLMRWAIVASSTRNAFAISAVVSPPTARSVSAIAEAGGQRRMAAHEQHDQRVVPIRDLRRRRLLQRRQALAVPPGPFAAPLVDQPPLGGLDQPAARLRRNTVSRPVQGGREQRLLDGVLGGVEVAVPANERAEDLRRQLAQQVLDTGRNVQRSPPTCCRNASISATSDGASSITCRTWIGCCVATPPGPGTAEIFAGDLDRTRLRLHVDDLVAGHPLLELLERPVGDHGRSHAVGGHDLGQVGPGQNL